MKQRWYFTFMEKQTGLHDKYIVFEGTHAEARQSMFNHYGDQWAFQYPEEQWVDEDGVTQAEKYGLTEIEQ